MIPVNYLAILVAAIAAMVLGFIWFGPLFGKHWLASMGWDSAKIDSMRQKGMNMTYVLQAVGALVMAYVLAHALIFASTYLNVSGPMAGITAGFWNWLGFVVPTSMGAVLWEGKSWKFWFITAGYYLVSLCLMGVILAVWV